MQRRFRASDSHDDFAPQSNVDVGSVDDAIRKDISSNKVFLYMKGVPEAPQCGFSNMVVQILDVYGARTPSPPARRPRTADAPPAPLTRRPTPSTRRRRRVREPERAGGPGAPGGDQSVLQLADDPAGGWRPPRGPGAGAAGADARGARPRQVYVDGEFVGGADIMMQLHQQGELSGVLGVKEE